MKRIFILIAIYVMFVTHFAFAQTHTQHISFDDTIGPGNAGTYNPTDHFGVDLYLTFEGYDSYGLSLWLETTADAAPYISLTGFTYGTTFGFPIQPFITYPLGFTVLQSTGLYTTPNPSDLGSLVLDPHTPVAPGTYFIGHLSVDLSGLAPGIYTLQTDATGPHASEATSCNEDETLCFDNYLPVSAYTITVVPEPSTFALLIVIAMAGCIYIFRRTVSRKSYPLG